MEEEEGGVVVLRVAGSEPLQKAKKRSLEMAQLDGEVPLCGNGSETGIDEEETDEEEEIEEDLREEIEAQLLSATPICSEGLTALHRAAASGLGRVVARLLAACPALLDIVAENEGTALHCAARNGHAAIVAQLLAVNPAVIDARANDGCTALHAAAQQGEAAIVAQLLTAKPALIDAKENFGRPALHYAAASGDAATVAQLLAAKPTSIEARANNGWTVLHYALGHDEITAQLLAAHPALLDAMMTEDDNWTALLNVVKMNHEEAVSRVLAMHPNLIHQLDPYCGWTVFHFAAYYGRDKVMSRLLAAAVSEHDLEQLLLQGSTKWADNASEGSTALHLAAKKGHSNIVTQLLAACPASIDVPDEIGQTCLHLAACEAHESIVETLLAFKPALAHAVDVSGDTILHTMLMLLVFGRNFSIEVLQRVWKMNPAALHTVNSNGHTPFDSAVAMRNDRAIELLQWSVTFEEIVSAYNKSGMTRLKSLMELQYEEVAAVLLPELVDTVFEYVCLKK